MRHNKILSFAPIASERTSGDMIDNRHRSLLTCCLACGKYSIAGYVVSRFLYIVSCLKFRQHAVSAMIPVDIKPLLLRRMGITDQEHHTGDIRNCRISSARRQDGKKLIDTHFSMQGILFSVHSLSVAFLAIRNWRSYSQR